MTQFSSYLFYFDALDFGLGCTRAWILSVVCPKCYMLISVYYLGDIYLASIVCERQWINQ